MGEQSAVECLYRNRGNTEKNKRNLDCEICVENKGISGYADGSPY